MKTREAREDLTFRLDQLRRSYKWFSETKFEKAKEEKERKKHLVAIKKEGEEIKAQLEAIPDYPTLFELRKDEDEALRLVTLLVIKVVDYFTTTEQMSNDMMSEVALRIIYQFGGLTLEDVAICFHQAMNAVHGKVYNRIDGAVLMNWLHKYEGDLREIGEEKNRRIHNQEKSGVWKEQHDYRIIQPRRLTEL